MGVGFGASGIYGRGGEVVRSCVVLRPWPQVSTAALLAWSRENMANYKVPRAVQIVSQLPVNAAGKVQKFALRKGDAG